MNERTGPNFRQGCLSVCVKERKALELYLKNVLALENGSMKFYYPVCVCVCVYAVSYDSKFDFYFKCYENNVIL